MLRSFLVTAGAALVLVPGALITHGAALVGAPAPGSPLTGTEARADYPAGITLNPGRLDRGPSTPLLHATQEAIVDGGLRVPLDGLQNVVLLQRIGADYVIQSANADFTRYAVRLVHPDGTRRLLQRFTDPTLVSASADGEQVALVTAGRAATRIRVVATRSGDLVARRTFAPNDVEITDYGVPRMVVTSYAARRTWWWNPETDRQEQIVGHLGWADISADRLVVLRPNPRNPDRFCQRTVQLSSPTTVLWRSCRDIPGAFSPDASRMVTWNINTDGLGPALVQVRRADGTVLRTYRAAWGFGFTVWESNRQVLLQAIGPKYAAAVRCSVGSGACERASTLFRIPPGGPPVTSMQWSFPQ